MKRYPIKKKLGILILLIFSISCSSDLNFEQVNTLKLEPVFIANLSYFDLPANEFVTNETEQNVAFDAQDFDVFRDSFFRDNLKRADLFFEINNTINRAYTIDILLFDLNNQPLYTIHFDVPAYNGTPNPITQTEIFENTKLDLLKNTRRLGFVLNMLSGPPLSESSVGNLKLRSGATVYLVVE